MDMDEFVKLMVEQQQFTLGRKELRQAFQIFDHENQGYFMSSELRNVFKRLEEKIPDEEINDILQDWENGQRKIVFGGLNKSMEFYLCVTQTDKH